MLQNVPKEPSRNTSQSASQKTPLPKILTSNTTQQISHQPMQNTPTAAEHDANPSPNPSANPATDRAALKDFSAEALAQALAEKLAIAPNDWHKLSANRQVRAREQAAAALVYMLKDQPEEALPRLSQAVGWLDRTLKAPPCPTHGEKRGKPS